MLICPASQDSRTPPFPFSLMEAFRHCSDGSLGVFLCARGHLPLVRGRHCASLPANSAVTGFYQTPAHAFCDIQLPGTRRSSPFWNQLRPNICLLIVTGSLLRPRAEPFSQPRLMKYSCQIPFRSARIHRTPSADLKCFQTSILQSPGSALRLNTTTATTPRLVLQIAPKS